MEIDLDKLNKKAAKTGDMVKIQNSVSIINGKTYSVKELNAIFNYNSLMLIESKEELLKYWYMAVETGIKRFICNVDNVFVKKFPKYE